jgi:hypothetical protein
MGTTATTHILKPSIKWDRSQFQRRERILLPEAESTGAGGQRRLCGLAYMDRTVIEHHENGLDLSGPFGAMRPVEFFQKSN